MLDKHYRLIDIARQIDRDKTTIIRWEEMGFLPAAERDSRGWRYYTEAQVKKILDLIKKTNYFRDEDRLAEMGIKARPHRMVYIGVVIAVLLISYQLFTLGTRTFAATANSTWFTTVSAGTLSIVSASTSNSFTGVSVSFSSQTSTAPNLGAVEVQDARGSGAGWTIALSGTDWKAGQDVMQLDYDGTGSNNNLGKMCIIVASGAIQSVAGQDTTGITKGSLGCFSASVTSLSIYTAAAASGKGDYWITDFSLQQFIPSNPTAQNLTTTLTLTLS
ncbi:MAG: MerR family transcriptional regulator [Candidatus Komeilibacteria bacterium]|nr:MerR family transcriptional regulator [Candidatus Komeilibacteria bacterium]